MSIKTSVVDTVTLLFHDDGRTNANTIVVTVPDNPDPLRHRYSGNPADPIRNATAQELLDAATAKAEGDATRALNGERLVKALALVVGDLTGRTPAQMAAAVKAKYKGLA